MLNNCIDLNKSVAHHCSLTMTLLKSNSWLSCSKTETPINHAFVGKRY